MKYLRIFVSIIMIFLVLFLVFLFVSYLLDGQIEERILERIGELEVQGRRVEVRWRSRGADRWSSRGGDSDMPKMKGPRAMRVLRRMMQSGEPRKKFWCSLMAADNGMLAEAIANLCALLDVATLGPDDKPYSEKAWLMLLRFIGEQGDPKQMLTVAEKERVKKAAASELSTGSRRYDPGVYR